MLRYPIDDETISNLSRFRGLTKFTLTVGSAMTPKDGDTARWKEKQEEFTKAVPLIGDILGDFVLLRNLNDMTGLDKMEMKMATDGEKFVMELKKKVRLMLAGK